MGWKENALIVSIPFAALQIGSDDIIRDQNVNFAFPTCMHSALFEIKLPVVASVGHFYLQMVF